MDALLSLLPPGEKGLLPYYLFFVGIVSVGNSLQNLLTLHYTRRIYNGLFVRRNAGAGTGDGAAWEDRVDKLVPASSTGKDKAADRAQDQVTPLAARVFGVWTLLAAAVRLYAAHDVGSRALYQLALLTHAVAAAHFTSELLVYRTLRLTGPQVFPLAAGLGGTVWMALQYHHYVE